LLQGGDSGAGNPHKQLIVVEIQQRSGGKLGARTQAAIMHAISR
jgi:hypothetical protein